MLDCQQSAQNHSNKLQKGTDIMAVGFAFFYHNDRQLESLRSIDSQEWSICIRLCKKKQRQVMNCVTIKL